ncbi:MAG: GGDEF domain-containing protein [Spirochaetes bacterium]|nr:GGDEF domain-containing protein [Spirochaetota bacterium]
MHKLSFLWLQRLSQVYFAFQPVVNSFTGQTYGFEALLRGHEAAGFTTIQAFFDAAASEGVLYSLDMSLREKALQAFLKIGAPETVHLFYNLDNRLLEMPDYSPGNTVELLGRYGFPTERMCFEVSERFPVAITPGQSGIPVLNSYREQHFNIALDDYGSGYAGLQLLYQAAPSIIKIDRFFITDIQTDARKKLFVEKLVETAHIMGVSVIAEGVETAREFSVCREIGCDFVQGFFIQRPQADPALLCSEYRERLLEAGSELRQASSRTRMLLARELDIMRTIPVDTPVHQALAIFRDFPGYRFAPVVNRLNEVMGILHEQDVKNYVYSPFGLSLLQNKSCSLFLTDLVRKTALVDINSRMNKVLDVFAAAPDSEVLVVTENGCYAGVLHSRSLIRILHETKLEEARDQNPLTKLPGNVLIQEYLSECVQDDTEDYLLVYFDFDNFKPFNDLYGFRQGDRVIKLFAELLQKSWRLSNAFIGHIGGDDFVVGIRKEVGDWPVLLAKLEGSMREFAGDVQAFYPVQTRADGYVMAKDRNGRMKKFSLLTVSAGVVGIRHDWKDRNPDLISIKLAELKKKAKLCSNHIAFQTFPVEVGKYEHPDRI